MAADTSSQDLYSIIQSLYQNQLGRPADNAGLGWWTNPANTQVQTWLSQGGVPQLTDAFKSGIQGAGDASFNSFKGNMAPQANQLTQPVAAQWQDYMAKAQAQQAGMNNAPGVFSDYNGLAAATPAQAQAMLYRAPDAQAAAIQATKDLWNTANPSKSDDSKKKTGGLGGLGGLTQGGLLTS